MARGVCHFSAEEAAAWQRIYWRVRKHVSRLLEAIARLAACLAGELFLESGTIVDHVKGPRFAHVAPFWRGWCSCSSTCDMSVADVVAILPFGRGAHHDQALQFGCRQWGATEPREIVRLEHARVGRFEGAVAAHGGVAVFVARRKVLDVHQEDFGGWTVGIPPETEMVQTAGVGCAVPLVPDVKVIGHRLHVGTHVQWRNLDAYNSTEKKFTKENSTQAC